MSRDEKDKLTDLPAQLPDSSAGKHPTKIRISEDAEATGEVATAYDFWRAGSGRHQVPGIIKCFGARPDFLRQVVEFSNTAPLFRRPSHPTSQGDDRQLRLLSQSLPVLTGQPRLLPACSGSHRSMRSCNSGRQTR